MRHPKKPQPTIVQGAVRTAAESFIEAAKEVKKIGKVERKGGQ